MSSKTGANLARLAESTSCSSDYGLSYTFEVCQGGVEFAKDLGKVCAMPENSGSLAEAVKARIQSKGWSQTTIAAKGGPSTTSLTKITSGQGNLSPKMLAQIDAGMEWEPGRAAQILAGGTGPVVTELASVSDEALLEEVRRRLKGASWSGDPAQEESELVLDTSPAIDLLGDRPPAETAGPRSPRAGQGQPRHR